MNSFLVGVVVTVGGGLLLDRMLPGANDSATSACASIGANLRLDSVRGYECYKGPVTSPAIPLPSTVAGQLRPNELIIAALAGVLITRDAQGIMGAALGWLFMNQMSKVSF